MCFEIFSPSSVVFSISSVVFKYQNAKRKSFESLAFQQKKYQGNYDNGKKSGEWFEWASNGELVISGFYKKGKKWDGLFKGIKYSSGKKVSS